MSAEVAHAAVHEAVVEADVDVRVDGAREHDAVAGVDLVVGARLARSRQRDDQLVLDQHVRLACAVGRDHEAAADGERAAHAAAPGTGWARRNASSSSASPVLSCSGGRAWPIAASAAANALRWRPPASSPAHVTSTTA